MAKDKDSAALKDSKKRKREGDNKSPSPLADPSSSKVTKKDKSEKKEKKEKKDKSEKKEKKDKKKKEKSQDADTSMADVEAAEDDVQMEVDVVGSSVVKDGEEASNALVPFAQPLAEGKLAKKVLKTTKKAAKTKALKRGVKEVVKAVRKSPNYATASKPDAKTLPLLILAADISPPDVISHLPVLAEDHGIPYVFVTSRAELGAAGATKRPTSVVMITPESAGRKRAGKKDKKGGDDGEKDKGLEKIKEEEEDFRSSYKDLVKEVMGITRALTV